MTRAAFAGLALALLAAVPLEARAQDAGAEPVPDAQTAADVVAVEQLVIDARTAVEQARLADARRLLERAFELEPSPAIGFNLALVLRDLGELIAARAMLERVLSGELGELPEDRSARAQEILREVSAAIATVMVRVTGPDRAEVRLDGAVAGTAVTGETLRITTDPGDHVILATAAGFEPADERLALARGDIQRVDLALVSTTARRAVAHTERAPAPPRERAVSDGGGGVLESPWLWAALVLVAAAGVTAAVLVATDDDPAEAAPQAPEGFLGTVTTP